MTCDSRHEFSPWLRIGSIEIYLRHPTAQMVTRLHVHVKAACGHRKIRLMFVSSSTSSPPWIFSEEDGFVASDCIAGHAKGIIPTADAQRNPDIRYYPLLRCAKVEILCVSTDRLFAARPNTIRAQNLYSMSTKLIGSETAALIIKVELL